MQKTIEAVRRYTNYVEALEDLSQAEVGEGKRLKDELDRVASEEGVTLEELWRLSLKVKIGDL